MSDVLEIRGTRWPAVVGLVDLTGLAGLVVGSMTTAPVEVPVPGPTTTVTDYGVYAWPDPPLKVCLR